MKNRKKFSLLLILALCLSMVMAEPALAASKQLSTPKLSTFKKSGKKISLKDYSFCFGKFTDNGQNTGSAYANYYYTFTASQTGKYTFRFVGESFCDHKSSEACNLSTVCIYKKVGNSLVARRATTQGGASSTIYVNERAGKIKTVSSTAKPLHYRYARMNLKKGDTIYFKVQPGQNARILFDVFQGTKAPKTGSNAYFTKYFVNSY